MSEQTVTNAVINYDGQIIPMPLDVAQDDEMLIKSLVPFYPEVATAAISRSLKDGTLHITLSKRAGGKGQGSEIQSVLAVLMSAPSHINPAIELYQEWLRKEPTLTLEEKLSFTERVQDVLVEGREEAALCRQISLALSTLAPSASPHVPTGF